MDKYSFVPADVSRDKLAAAGMLVGVLIAMTIVVLVIFYAIMYMRSRQSGNAAATDSVGPITNEETDSIDRVYAWKAGRKWSPPNEQARCSEPNPSSGVMTGRSPYASCA